MSVFVENCLIVIDTDTCLTGNVIEFERPLNNVWLVPPFCRLAL